MTPVSPAGCNCRYNHSDRTNKYGVNTIVSVNRPAVLDVDLPDPPILSMPSLEHNIETLKKRIDAACITANRTPDSVQLLAVSKTQPAEAVAQAYTCGQRSFGENYVSEAVEKITQLPSDIDWHFIGPIQSNKSRLIAEHFAWVHSIDRPKLVERLATQRPANLPPLKCLIQVNISQEATKSGCAIDAIAALADNISQHPNLLLKGLMAIPSPSAPAAQSTAEFAKMRELSDQLQALYPTATELSMGMSSDLEPAIAHGATIVRIGTALFGPRRNKTTTATSTEQQTNT